jgi:hypothetical protein
MQKEAEARALALVKCSIRPCLYSAFPSKLITDTICRLVALAHKEWGDPAFPPFSTVDRASHVNVAPTLWVEVRVALERDTMYAGNHNQSDEEDGEETHLHGEWWWQ